MRTPAKSIRLIMFVLFCQWLLLAMPAMAVDMEEADDSAEEETGGPDIDVTMEKLERTVEITHERIAQGLLDQVIRLDDFFGNPKTEKLKETSYQLRWRNFCRIEGGGGDLKPGTTFRLNVALSRISDRLRLAISGDNTSDPTTQTIPADPGNPGFDRTTPTARLVNTELRYDLHRTPFADLFVGAGFRLVLPPESFLRTRFQYTSHLSEKLLMRTAETLFLKNREGFGSTTEIDLERLLAPELLLRWSNSGTVAQEIRGLEWGSELSLSKKLSSKSAATVITGVYGNSSAQGLAQNYRIATRYRRNFLKSWLYYELEPEISWPRGADGSHDPHLAFTVLLEVVFQGASKSQQSEAPLP